MTRSYRQGDSITCPACGRESVVKAVTKMSGWTVAGRYYCCAICGYELAEIAESTAGPPHRSAESERKTDALSAFLGQPVGETASVETVLGVAKSSTTFCKDCLHFYRHPFMDKCLLHRRPAQPMSDCPQFERRPDKSPDDSAENGSG